LNWLRAVSLLAVLLLLIPIAVILYYGLGPLRNPAGYSVQIFRSIELSLVSSALAVAVNVLLFTPLAYYLARQDRRDPRRHPRERAPSHHRRGAVDP
jgi:molybdate/tungstate transport system permease protein